LATVIVIHRPTRSATSPASSRPARSRRRKDR
jgi:hypothetical protein